MKKLLLLLLVVSVAFSASCASTAIDILNPNNSETTLIYLALGLSVILIALAYAFGSATHNAETIVFAKDELYHLGVSVVLLASFAGLLGASCLLSDSFVGIGASQIPQNSACYAAGSSSIDVAYCYTTMLQSKAAGMVSFFTSKQIKMIMDSGWSYTAGAFLQGTFTTMMEAYKKIYAMQFDTLSNVYVMPALISISVQKILLQLIKENIVQFILPAAFALRFFPPTRTAGNFLIAFCIALYAVFPFFAAFTFMMYDAVYNDCSTYSAMLYDKPINNEAGAPVCSQTGDVMGVSMWDVGVMIPMAFFLPNLSLALLITFLGAVNKALRVVG